MFHTRIRRELRQEKVPSVKRYLVIQKDTLFIVAELDENARRIDEVSGSHQTKIVSACMVLWRSSRRTNTGLEFIYQP